MGDGPVQDACDKTVLDSKPGAEALGRNGEKKSESGKANFRLGFDSNEGREC